jgi:hypothetical protein
MELMQKDFTMTRLRLVSFLLFSLLLTSVLTSQAAPRNSFYPGGWYVELESFNGNAQFDKHAIFGTEVSWNCTDCSHNCNHTTDDDNWHAGYYVGIGYDFCSCNPCRNWGLSLAYTYYDNNKSALSDAIIGGNGEPLLVPIFVDFSAGPFSGAQLCHDTEFQTIDGLVHHNFRLCNGEVQLFGGLRYLKLEHDRRFEYRTDPRASVIGSSEDLRIFSDHAFRGIGPVLGVNAFMPIYCNLGIAGELAGTMLWGDKKNRIQDVFFASFPELPSTQIDPLTESRSCDDNRNVTGLSAQLALAYHTTFCNCSRLALEVGYRVDEYFDIHDQLRFQNPCHCNDSFNGDRNDDDFLLHGPFVKVTIRV